MSEAKKKKGSRSKRARQAEGTFQVLLDRVDSEVKSAADDPNVVLNLKDDIRQNLRLSLDERLVEQKIKESRRRISTDEQLIALLDREVVARNFVERDAERERWRKFLIDEMQFPFTDQLLERMYPEQKKARPFSESLMTEWRRMRNAGIGPLSKRKR